MVMFPCFKITLATDRARSPDGSRFTERDLAGPVGLLVGMITGSLEGPAFESTHFDFSEDIIKKVKDHLQLGEVAIIGEVSKENPAFLENALEPLSARI